MDPSQLPSGAVVTYYSIPALDATGSPLRQRADQIASGKFRVLRPSVLVSLLNPRIPRAYLAPGSPDSICSTEFAVLQPNPGARLLPEYLLLFVSSDQFKHSLASLVAGTTGSRQRVRPAILSELEIDLPPLAAQRRIVDLMSGADAAKASATATGEALRKARQALLIDLLLGSSRSDNWREVVLGDVATIRIGRTPPRSEARFWTTDLERPFCTIADMSARVVFPRREGVTEVAEVEGKAKRVPAGSLLLSFKLTIGRVGFAGVDVFPNEAIAWVEPIGTEIDKRYLILWLGAADLESRTGRAVKGMTLNSASLNSIPVAVPSLAEQRRIVDLIGSLDDTIYAQSGTDDALAATRQALLANLLTGNHAIPASYDRFLDGVA